MMNFDEEMNVGIVDFANAQAKEKRFRKTAVLSGILALFLVAVAMMRNSGSTTPTAGVFDRQLQLKGMIIGDGEDDSGDDSSDGGNCATPTGTCQVMFYTAGDVAGHAARNDCWFILYDVVYDITDYVDRHPGGASRIYDECGTDATQAYTSIHSQSRVNCDGKGYIIGKLGSSSGIQEAP
jgi:hypothetical protein